MLPARYRLRNGDDFSVASRGVRQASRLMVLHATHTDARAALPPRVGFVVSKAVGNAVVRNRTKRVLRALMAQRIDQLSTGTDLVVRANPAATDASTALLAADLDQLLAGVLHRSTRTRGTERNRRRGQPRPAGRPAGAVSSS